MESRRDALKIMLATAAAAATTTAVDNADAKLVGTPIATADGASEDQGVVPWSLVAPLQVGDLLGGTWRLASVGTIIHGAVVLELHDLETQRARIHVCAREGASEGLASTGRLDLILMNGGNGKTASDEYLGRVVLGLAALIEQNEDRAFKAHPELAGLMTHEERLTVYKGTAALS